jgi:protein SCO1/2
VHLPVTSRAFSTIRRAGGALCSRASGRDRSSIAGLGQLRRVIARSGSSLCLLALASGAAAAAGDPRDVLTAAAIETAKLGASIPSEVMLEDAGGQTLAIGDLLGRRPVLLAPVDYRCKNICGFTIAGLLGALDELEWRPGQDYDLVVFSIDPASRATDAGTARQEQLARFPSLADEGVRFLAGDASALTAAVGFRYAYDAETEQYIHPAAVAVVTPEGRLSRWLYGYPFEASDLRLALVETGGGAIGTLSDRVWLLCYGYDPATGKYSAAVHRLLEAGGSLTVLLLGGLVLRMLRRERRISRDDR